MSTSMRRREESALWPTILDWFEEGLPRVPERLRGTSETSHGIRIEEFVKDNRLVVRAELPGIDAEKDVDVTVDRGVLTISARREEREEHEGRTEFRYGSFMRRVVLPDGVDESDVTASYTDGILEVTVAMPAEVPQPRHVPIARRGE